MRIIAFYLPQFHEIQQNNEWWGKGFTEWVNVKKAKPLNKSHYQPRIPMNNNYYDLTDLTTLQWQQKIAKEHGIYGFCYYHYWYEGEQLLQKPAEIMLNNKSVDMPFCFSWANESWSKAWVGKPYDILIEQTYGDEESWKKHFLYLYDFFVDDRYIKIDGKPLFVIYRPNNIPKLGEMLELWQNFAKERGLPGIAFSYQQHSYDHTTDSAGNMFDYSIEYQPSYAFKDCSLLKRKMTIKNIINKLNLIIYKITKSDFERSIPNVYDYDKLWQSIIRRRPNDEKSIPGAFVDWDNTPRWNRKGSYCKGVSVEKFKKYFSMQLKNARENYKKDMLFIFAWNEWAESGYLEPDEKNNYGYLEAIKQALIENGELPEVINCETLEADC